MHDRLEEKGMTIE